MSVLLGNGDGTFRTSVQYATGLDPLSVAEGDVNGDGNPDIVTANSGSNTVSVLLGNGDGTFQAKVDYATGGSSGGNPYSVAVGDFNGDDKLDIVTANGQNENSSVSVLVGNGDGTFQPNVDFVIGSPLVNCCSALEAESVAVGDLNGDGRADLVTALNDDDTVSVLLNSWQASTVSVFPSTLSSGYGQTITFKASVSPSGGTPTGSVQFLSNGTDFGTPVSLSDGVASITSVALKAGQDVVSARYLGDINFMASTDSADVSVSKASLTVTATGVNRAYDGTIVAIVALSDDHLGGDVVNLSYATATFADKNVGNGKSVSVAGISISGQDASNYNLLNTTASTTANIAPTPLTVAATSDDKIFDDTVGSSKAPTYQVTGLPAGTLFPGDSFSTLTQAFQSKNALGTGGSTLEVSYVLNDGNAGLNYEETTLTAEGTITPAPLTVTANAGQTKVYGAVIPTLTYTLTGFAIGDTSSVVSGAPTLSTGATAASHVTGGPYPILVSAGSLWALNYSFVLVDGALSVTPAPLTITANNATKAYGAALPMLSASYSGLLNGDTQDSLTTPPALATTAAASSHVLPGGYAIIAWGASDPDYTIRYQTGTLLVTPAPLVITANSALDYVWSTTASAVSQLHRFRQRGWSRKPRHPSHVNNDSLSL